jgi:hypothetical protein
MSVDLLAPTTVSLDRILWLIEDPTDENDPPTDQHDATDYHNWLPMSVADRAFVLRGLAARSIGEGLSSRVNGAGCSTDLPLNASIRETTPLPESEPHPKCEPESERLYVATVYDPLPLQLPLLCTTRRQARRARVQRQLHAFTAARFMRSAESRLAALRVEAARLE